MPRFAGIPVEQQKAPRFAGQPVADFSGVTATSEQVAGQSQPRTIPQELARSVGLGARSLIGSASDLVGIVSNPFIEGANLLGANQQTQQQAGEALSDYLGLPRPETGTERVASGITRALGAGGGTIGIGRGLAAEGAALAPTVASRIGQTLATQPGRQVAGAALGSGASEVTREAGGGPVAQTVAGVIGSVAPGAAIPAARAVVSPVTAPFQGVTASGADRAVADILREGAQDPEALFRVAPSAVPGVTRSLAEETLDPGVAALQRQYGSGPLREQAAVSNQARVEELTRQFGGANEIAAEGFRQEANNLARQTARGLRRAGGENIDNQQVIGLADAALARTRQEPIRRAIEAAKGLVEQPFRNAAEAWDARQGIDALIRGKNSDFPDSKLAQKQLLLLKGALDRQMRRAYPEWGRFLKQYEGIQRKADQVGIGETLLSRGGVTGLTAEGQATTALSPAKFRNITDDLDQLARTATGFPKASAAGTLTDQQIGAIRNVRDDILRIAETQRTGVSGSPTAQNLETRSLIEDAIQNRAREILSAIPVAGAVSGALTNVARRRIENRLQMILANPDQARTLLRNAPAEDQRVLEAALGQFGATASTLATQGAP